MMMISLALVLAAASPAQVADAEINARRFVAAVIRGIDPVVAGIVPALTKEQLEQLAALRPCKFGLLGTSTKEQTRILWHCGRGGKMKSWMTQLNFDKAIISSVAIEPVFRRLKAN